MSSGSGRDLSAESLNAFCSFDAFSFLFGGGGFFFVLDALLLRLVVVVFCCGTLLLSAGVFFLAGRLVSAGRVAALLLGLLVMARTRPVRLALLSALGLFVLLSSTGGSLLSLVGPVRLALLCALGLFVLPSSTGGSLLSLGIFEEDTKCVVRL